MSQHVLRCPACKETGSYTRPESPKPENCVSCGFTLINCGPLPSPDWTIPSASALEPELKVYTPPPATVEEVPKWACPWCGGNVGVTKKCKRCSCDLTQVAPISLRDWVDGLPPPLIGAYRDLAMYPMDGSVALIRLYRLDPDAARRRQASESLVRKMRLTPAPPGVDLQLAPKQSTIGLTLDQAGQPGAGERNRETPSGGASAKEENASTSPWGPSPTDRHTPAPAKKGCLSVFILLLLVVCLCQAVLQM